MRMEAGKAWEARAALCEGEPLEWGSHKKTPMHTHGRSCSGAGNRI